MKIGAPSSAVPTGWNATRWKCPGYSRASSSACATAVWNVTSHSPGASAWYASPRARLRRNARWAAVRALSSIVWYVWFQSTDRPSRRHSASNCCSSWTVSCPHSSTKLRRVQNYYGVRCDPTLPYDAAFTPPHEGGEGKSIKAADQVPISRRNFVELCGQLTVQDEQQFEALWRHLGLSVDWSHTYQTIDDNARTAAQRAFLRNLARGEAYQAEAPGLWDVTFQTAVAQAELEARDYPGHFHRVAFHPVGTAGGGAPIFIE